MFEISQETKSAAITAMREILGEDPSDRQLEDSFEAAVKIVKSQFGF